MARINELIRRIAATSPELADDIEKEYNAVAGRLAFGLNFERHTPEAVELPGRPVRTGDKVHILPPRGENVKAENKVIWVVESIDKVAQPKVANLIRSISDDDVEETVVDVDDLVVIAEFRDPIYPGLVSTGKVERGGDKPFHTVINSENFHALEALMFTHRGKVDAIYIDPPYNTGAKDWKYNNDYVEAEDLYRHSKWLAFMERRLLLAKELLNPDDSVLIVTIDEKEYLRLGQLLEQVFSGSTIQMVSSIINRAGSTRRGMFSRVDEYIFYVFIGDFTIQPHTDNMLHEDQTERVDVPWRSLRRTTANGRREARPNLFYPIFFNEDGSFNSVGDSMSIDQDKSSITPPAGTFAVFPIKDDGTEMRWGLQPSTLRTYFENHWVRWGKIDTKKLQPISLSYLASGATEGLANGTIIETGRDDNGTVIVQFADSKISRPMSVWNRKSHLAGEYGSTLVDAFIPKRDFPFPKSLYAVEDALRFAVKDKRNALVVDFFSGSGTTAHAVMRLNKQDGGRRVSISVTNNEVSADEQKNLRKKGMRPGDSDWEQLGICDFITKPRIEAAIIGKTPDGNPVKGEYKFTDEFSMADGFEANAEFFTLTYETPLRVTANLAFDRIAPLLWLRAGSTGRRIEILDEGWDVAETYGVLSNLDKTDKFAEAVAGNTGVTHVFIITDEDRLFEAVVRELPANVECVRLYDDYIRNFEIDAMRVTR